MLLIIFFPFCILLYQPVYYDSTAISCPSGMVYQQCGPSCPQTCDTNEDTDCGGGCVEGCFCPTGQVLFNGKCVNETECQGKLSAAYTCTIIL